MRGFVQRFPVYRTPQTPAPPRINHPAPNRLSPSQRYRPPAQSPP